jgi:hypothetical protein
MFGWLNLEVQKSGLRQRRVDACQVLLPCFDVRRFVPGFRFNPLIYTCINLHMPCRRMWDAGSPRLLAYETWAMLVRLPSQITRANIEFDIALKPTGGSHETNPFRTAAVRRK